MDDLERYTSKEKLMILENEKKKYMELKKEIEEKGKEQLEKLAYCIQQSQNMKENWEKNGIPEGDCMFIATHNSLLERVYFEHKNMILNAMENINEEIEALKNQENHY